MKTFSAAALDAIDRGDAIVSAAVAVYCTPPIFVWGGYGDLTFTGDTGSETYKGIGAHGGLGQQSGGRIGGTAQKVTLTLSGIDPKALELMTAAEVKNAGVVVRRLIYDSTGKTLLGAYVFTRGRLDTLTGRETVGGTAVVEAVIETAARGLGRRGGRLRSDADQRLIAPTDGFFKSVSFAAEKTLYWGGKRPASAGSALGGSAAAAGGGGFLLGGPVST